MKFLSKEKSKVLAERNGWTLAHAEGYVEGQRARKRGTMPQKYVLVGLDDYSQGFRAGYFSRSTNRKADPSVDKYKLRGSHDL